MKLFTAILSLVLLSAIVGCGDEGIGFNIGKEVSAPIPVDLPFSSVPYVPDQVGDYWDQINFNPDGYTETTEYNLSEFVSEDDLDALDAVLINRISYEIAGLDANEEVDLDELTISYSIKETGLDLGSISLARLENVAKTTSNINSAALSEALFSNQTVIAQSYIDFAALPSGDIEFEFKFYFDVVAKIRQ